VDAFLILARKTSTDAFSYLAASGCECENSFQTHSFALRKGCGWCRRRCDLRWMHAPVVVVALFHPPNPGAPTRALSHGETQCSKVRSDVVRDGPSLRSQTTIEHAAYPALEQQTTIHIPQFTPRQPARRRISLLLPKSGAA
jgi:hypothetical protein